ncbi:MAG TPA: outer membrane beta-barrel protein [Candidatus Methanoperedens sp.]|nr:outer membrane beta-barrel protein [Candidatus Methanoperedens sp.]
MNIRTAGTCVAVPFAALLCLTTRIPRAGAQEGGIPLGPLRLHPSLTVTLTHDDNVTLASDHRTADWITTVAPAARLALPVRHVLFELEGGLAARSFGNLDQEDATDWFVGAAAAGDFPGGLDFKVSDRYAERRLVASQEYGPGETGTLDTLAATAGYRVRDALRLELGARRAAYDYGRSLSRERVETTLQADCFWRFRPRTSAFVEGARTRFAYDENAAQDGSETLVALGLTWEATSRSTALVKAGYEWKRYEREHSGLGTVDGEYFVLVGGARHDLTRRTAVEVELSRGSYESDFPRNPYYLRTAFAAGLSHLFTTRISGRVFLRYARDEFPHAVVYQNPRDPGGVENGERTDRALGLTAAVGYEATRWLTLEAAWSGERRASSFDTFDYAVNRVSLSARAAF